MIQQEKRRDRIEIELNKVTKQYEELIKNRKDTYTSPVSVYASLRFSYQT